jgi:hypothetical protein
MQRLLKIQFCHILVSSRKKTPIHCTFVFLPLKKYKNHCTLLLIFLANPTPWTAAGLTSSFKERKILFQRNCKLKGKMKGAGYIVYSV